MENFESPNKFGQKSDRKHSKVETGESNIGNQDIAGGRGINK